MTKLGSCEPYFSLSLLTITKLYLSYKLNCINLCLTQNIKINFNNYKCIHTDVLLDGERLFPCKMLHSYLKLKLRVMLLCTKQKMKCIYRKLVMYIHTLRSVPL